MSKIKAFHVSQPIVTLAPAGGTIVSTTIAVDGYQRQIFFESSKCLEKIRADFLLPIILLPAATKGYPVIFDSPISEELLSHLGKIQDIYSQWSPKFKRVEVISPRVHVHPSGNRKAACFFTAGVDSFYTLFKHAKEIETLIFIHGHDIYLCDIEIRKRMSHRLKIIASKLHKELIEVITNVRVDFLDYYVSFRYGGGGILGSIGLLLAELFQTVYIAADYSYPLSDSILASTGPSIDSLWNNGEVVFRHDGDDVSRTEKTIFIAQSEIALDNLKVCNFYLEKNINCGRCEKCTRTMMDLRIAGKLIRSRAFPYGFDPRRILEFYLSKFSRPYYETALNYLKRQGNDPEIERILEQALRSRKIGFKKWMVFMLAHLHEAAWWCVLLAKIPPSIRVWLRRFIYSVIYSKRLPPA